MATVRNYTTRPDIQKAVEDARETLLTCWDEWDADAGQDAQREQSNDAWFAAMNAQIDCVLFGLLDQIADIKAEEA